MSRRSLTLVASPAIVAVLLAALLWPAPALAQTTQVVEYYHTDALGSVRAVTNQQGQVIRRHDFLPFGEELQATVPPPDKPLFTGKERDVETGLDYFGARYQRAGVGRFTSVDPVMTFDKSLADPQRWNRYAYARTNPMRWVDPDGRIPIPITGYLPFMKWADKARESVSGALGDGTLALVADALLAGILPKNPRELSDAGTAAILGVAAPLNVGQAGRFADLASKGVKGDKLTPHHMPQVAAAFTNRAEGGALMLTEAEHQLTRTYGFNGALTAQQEVGMTFRDVLARDIRDVRGLSGSQYNLGLRELLDYYRMNFPVLMMKK